MKSDVWVFIFRDKCVVSTNIEITHTNANRNMCSTKLNILSKITDQRKPTVYGNYVSRQFRESKTAVNYVKDLGTK
jgi:hypothetical protein